MRPNLVKRGPMRRRLRILRRRREAMLLDLGALVLEMHRHGRFLPDSLQRRAAEAVGTDAELRALSRALEAGAGDPDLVAAGVAGNCDRCGALHTLGSSYCAQCGNELPAGVLPRKAALGSDPELAGGAPIPRRTVAPAAAAAAAATPASAHSTEQAAETTEATELLEPDEAGEAETDAGTEPDTTPPEPAASNGGSAPPPPPPINRRARATRVRQRLDEPARSSQNVPTGLLAGIAAGLIVIVVGILLLSGGGDDDGGSSDRAEQAPAQGEPEPPPPDEVPSPSEEQQTPATALEPVEDVTASDYDPSGDNEEHGEAAPLAVDGDTSTSWPTEEYDTGSLQKDGVGLSLQPAQAVAARGLDLETTTPGFDMTIYGAEDPTAPTSIDSGWTEIASEDAVERKGRIDLDSAGREFSHYLIWITAVPKDENKVEIVEGQLLR